jgi:hypothetical protein
LEVIFVRLSKTIRRFNMKKILAFAVSVFLFLSVSWAQEGMWLLTQIGQLDLNKKGLELAISDVYSKDKPSVYNAVIQLGGGTASFVSPDGLIITNHHVAFTALQRASDVKSDFITEGFLARNRNEEIKAPGYRARLLLDMKDVTTDILDAGKSITDPTERDRKIRVKIEEMTSALEKGKDDIEVNVSEMYNGKQYIQFTYKVFKDVRIVYSPPLSIGNYGGETDNWMWPRHTGDFSFLRVYAASDGTGREYNTANVPYKPKVWMKVAKEGLKDGDFTFVIGYPGQTTRYRSATSVNWNEKYNYPFAIQNFQDIISLIDKLTENNKEGEIKTASFKKGLANAMKNYQGKLEGMKKTHFLDKKIAFEKDFNQWANSNPETKKKYGDILAKEKEQYNLIARTRERDNVFNLFFYGNAGTPISVAGQIYSTAKEMEKPESERRPGYNEKALIETAENMQYAYSNYWGPVDKALFVKTMNMAADLPADQRISGIEYVVKGGTQSISQFADNAFATSKLTDPEYAKSLVNKSPKELEALNDPFINMAVAMYPMSEEIRKTGETFNANVTAVRKVYLDGIYEWKGKNMYPDANGTMRFTSGNVKGYRPHDAVWYDPLTTLAGVVEKNTGIEPFDAPPALVSLFGNKDFGRWADPKFKDVPVAFLSQCDITGGNSGSPIMNSKGELVGVIFDGNYEAMISDWQYDLALQRAISVDIRYVLFVTEKFANAGFILDEMGVGR